MLLCLNIKNFALLDSAEINFTDGFNVLTGETGAGKSILIGSINMLLGERTSRDVIRYGEKAASVQGLFYVNHPRAAQALASLGIEPEEDGAVLVSRELHADGRNICRINGRLVPVNVLKSAGGWLVNIHGQQDNQSLLDHTAHIGFLDRFAGKNMKDALEHYRGLYSQMRSVEQELSALNMDEAEKLRKLDLLSYEIQELRAANLTEGEEEELRGKRNILANAKRLIAFCGQATDALYDNVDGECAYNYLAAASDCMTQAAAIDGSFESAAATLAEVLAAVEETTRQINAHLDNLNLDGAALEEVEERLDVIYHMKRKYGGSVEAALSHLEKIEREYEGISTADERIKQLSKELEKLRSQAEAAAQMLHGIRIKTAETVKQQIDETLAFLDMPGASFAVSVEPCELNGNGADKVEFLMSTNRGEPLKPMVKIVSGGELSRIMLAIKSILAASDAVGTLIFDEIDTGVSGRAAQKIGAKLKALSCVKQVICVTHLAQIAAIADSHFLISKQAVGEKTSASVALLEHVGRVEELARIIGGDTVTDTTRKQAEEMLHDS